MTELKSTETGSGARGAPRAPAANAESRMRVDFDLFGPAAGAPDPDALPNPAAVRDVVDFDVFGGESPTAIEAAPPPTAGERLTVAASPGASPGARPAASRGPRPLPATGRGPGRIALIGAIVLGLLLAGWWLAR